MARRRIKNSSKSFKKAKLGVTVTGVKEIDIAFKKYNKEMKKILRQNMRKGMKDLHSEIVSNFPKDTGETAKGIKVRAGIKVKRGTIKIDVRSKDDNHIAKWIEFGTETEDGTVRIEEKAPFRKAHDTHGDSARKVTIEGATKDANALLKRMAKEDKKK